MKIKREIGEIWKDNFTSKEPYTIQFSYFRIGAKTKKEAKEKSELAIKLANKGE